EIQSYIRELHDYIVEYPQPLEAFAHAWADVTMDIIDFAARYPADCHMLKYEDLAANPDAEMKRITDFLGLPASAMNADSVLGKKSVDGIGDWKSYKKIKVETGSVNRWQSLPAAAIDRLAPIVAETLAAAGYPALDTGSAEDAQRRRELAQMMMKAREV
ncbi:MAG: sulfotransferase, partial [Alphaproteobacteria bacterium]|nr:sulfotransferase [Alphaproteobacteria bacterium]